MHSDKPHSFKEGDWLDGTPYRVVRLIGSGGMGEVYEVDHTRTGTRRAVKVTRRTDEQSIMPRRLLREARALQTIDHPNVVRVYEVGALNDGRPYFAMELLDGICLRSIIAEQAPVSFERAIRLILQVLDGLAAVQTRGFVHRDIKPSNVFVDKRGVAKVIDLGIAKPMSPFASGPRTKEGMVVGTTRYMAPEQLMGAPVDSRADVYSAGLVLLELIVGKQQIDTAWREGKQVSLPKDLPPKFKDVVRRALARDPSRRFGSAQEMADAVREWFDLPSTSKAPDKLVVPARSVPVQVTQTGSYVTQSGTDTPTDLSTGASVDESIGASVRASAGGSAASSMAASTDATVVIRRERKAAWGFRLGAAALALFVASLAAGLVWKVASRGGAEGSRCEGSAVSAARETGI
ncbi:MAG: serine/threonine protein kinase [Polyangiaceae bacterium]|nr:serine/threonine protein kinase [Polyangiaceae bacterium]